MPDTREPDLVDQLIPTPWGPGRRRAVGALLVVMGLALGVAWWGGLLGPNLASVSSFGWSAGHVAEAGVSGDVEVELPLANRGWLPITDIEVVPPDATGATIRATDVPDRIPAGEEVMIRLEVEVTDCARFRVPRDATGIVIRGTSGLVPRTATARFLGSFDEPVTWHDGWAPPSPWNLFAGHVCDPDWGPEG